MAKKLTIHLSGPLSGCNEHQKHLWREEFKKLCHGFAYSDPSDWHAQWRPIDRRELRAREPLERA
jgi:hypothetical protein